MAQPKDRIAIVTMNVDTREVDWSKVQTLEDVIKVLSSLSHAFIEKGSRDEAYLEPFLAKEYIQRKVQKAVPESELRKMQEQRNKIQVVKTLPPGIKPGQ